ncbi:CD177 antigen isoform X1 [Ailuropoda melanoleuca]|uniref:CD177 molecule n=2 Tax=Ailuropoda melanoleuca TaxID=9646 RepID=G1LCK1_AILME|nr:CD177 antigen isoform X1 [Ailuropoda melanoleuca]
MFLRAGGSGSLDSWVQGSGEAPDSLPSETQRVGPDLLYQGSASRPLLARYKRAGYQGERTGARVPASLTMSPALQLALLGTTFMLSRVQALICQWGTHMSLRNVSELPLEWSSGQQSCEDGWGCQDTLILIENGPQVSMVISKGCTPVADEDVLIREHRAGPGVAILSYTHVCREKDNCNSLSTSLPLWTLPSTTGPGSLRCPVCLSTEDCDSAAELTCPAGSTHCYRGAIQVTGGDIFSILRVQGCASEAGCNLLNGTRRIGPIEMREDCSPSAFLTCQRGVTIYSNQDLSQNPIEWTTGHYELCNVGEVCQETLLLVDVGLKSMVVGSKGCSAGRTQDAPTITIHSGPPGVLVASYAHFCSSNRCNRASNTSVLLNSLPPPAAPAPGNLQCPVCVNIFGSCPENPENVMCPNGTTHCYSGYIKIQKGGIYSKLNIQGCVTQASSSLLNHAWKIGVFSVTENSEDETDFILQAGAAPMPLLPWVVGLGLSLALWCGMPMILSSLLTP